MTVTATAKYAFNPRQGDRSDARYHAVIDTPIAEGRFVRAAGDALCRPARKFWGLAVGNPSAVNCPRCLVLAQRYDVRLPNCPRGVAGCIGGCEWKCPDCGCRNCHEVFCYLCGAGSPEEDGDPDSSLILADPRLAP